MKKYFLPFIIALSFLLNGCTAILWSEDFKPKQTYSKKHIDSDVITSFGEIKTDEGKKIVFIGNKYFFVTESKQYEKLSKILNLKLSEPFKIKKDIINLTINEEGKSFYTGFHIYYKPKSEQEEKILEEIKKDLDFRKIDYERDYDYTFKDYYRSYLSLSGEIFKKENEMNFIYSFENKIPVSLSIEVKDNMVVANSLDFIQKITYTPITLFGDLILFSVAVPFSIIGNAVNTSN